MRTWYSATNINVTANSTDIEVVVGGDVSYFSKPGCALFISGYPEPFEVETGFLDGSGARIIRLFDPFPGASADGLNAFAFPGAVEQYDSPYVKEKYELNPDTNVFTDEEKVKLTGVLAGAQPNDTAAQLLIKLLTVAGPGSTLDADTVDGLHAGAFATAQQGDKADSAAQSAQLAPVSFSGDYSDLINKPSAGVSFSSHVSEANFPAAGAGSTIYHSQQSGAFFYWNGISYQSSSSWGGISGDITQQADLVNWLSGKMDYDPNAVSRWEGAANSGDHRSQGYAVLDNLPTVARTGRYADLIGKPTFNFVASSVTFDHIPSDIDVFNVQDAVDTSIAETRAAVQAVQVFVQQIADLETNDLVMTDRLNDIATQLNSNVSSFSSQLTSFEQALSQISGGTYTAPSYSSDLTGASGYQELPGGVILQWGVELAVPGDSATAASFSAPFNAQVFSVQGTLKDDFDDQRDAGVGCYNITNTGFTLKNGCGTAKDIQWFAIGI